MAATKDVPPAAERQLHPGRAEEEQKEFPLRSQGFPASVWLLFNITGHFGNHMWSPLPFPPLASHTQAKDGVRTLQLIEVPLKVNWCFYWCE